MIPPSPSMSPHGCDVRTSTSWSPSTRWTLLPHTLFFDFAHTDCGTVLQFHGFLRLCGYLSMSDCTIADGTSGSATGGITTYTGSVGEIVNCTFTRLVSGSVRAPSLFGVCVVLLNASAHPFLLFSPEGLMTLLSAPRTVRGVAHPLVWRQDHCDRLHVPCFECGDRRRGGGLQQRR